MGKTFIYLAIILPLLARWFHRGLRIHFDSWRKQRLFRRCCRIPHAATTPAYGFPQKKPEWVRHVVLVLHESHGLSHRKLSDAFNQRYAAATGITVGRTWVRELLKRQAYEALHRQKALKHLVPPPLRRNLIWGIDTTFVRDAHGHVHQALGIVDHGTRLNIALRWLKHFNAWTFLGCVFLAIGQFGRPVTVKTDNHAVFHSRWVKRVLRWAGIRQCFSRPASPWENGRIERFFGTLKSCLRGYVIGDARHLARALADFQFWYNVVRPHQHLGGTTPAQMWHGIDPYRQAPKAVLGFEAWDGRLRGCVLRH